MRLSNLLLIVVIIMFTVILFLSIFKGDSEKIIGYQVQEMIRAKDSTHYFDTVGTIYKQGDMIILKEKPYSEYK